MAPSCAITHSVFSHKRHAGPFKNISTQHPPLHTGATWCHNQAPCWVCSLSSLLLCIFFFSDFLTMDASCPFLCPCFTSESVFPPEPPWPETLSRSEEWARMSSSYFCCRMFWCPAGEFLKQLTAYESVSCNLLCCTNITIPVDYIFWPWIWFCVCKCLCTGNACGILYTALSVEACGQCFSYYAGLQGVLIVCVSSCNAINEARGGGKLFYSSLQSLLHFLSAFSKALLQAEE